MKLSPWFSLITILVLAQVHVLGQERYKPIVVSPLIGDTLDVVERNIYDLFPTIDGFQWAVFYLNPDSSLTAQVDIGKFVTFVRRYVQLHDLRGHIREVAEELKRGSKEGASVILLVRDGRQLAGELLSVRDSALVISTFESEDKIVMVRNQEIRQIVIEGESKVAQGMGLGTLIGGGIGALIGLADGDDTRGFIRFSAGQKAAIGAVLFGGAGFVIGTIAGIATSTGDVVVKPPMSSDFSALKPFARFPLDEPEYLQAIK